MILSVVHQKRNEIQRNFYEDKHDLIAITRISLASFGLTQSGLDHTLTIIITIIFIESKYENIISL